MNRQHPRSAANRMIGGAMVAALMAVSTPSHANEPCAVTFTNITEFTYSRHNLTGRLLTGTASLPNSAEFSIMDDDGFLTLAAMMSSWQDSGKAEENKIWGVPISRSELSLLHATILMGQRYQDAVLATLEETPIAERDTVYAHNVVDATNRRAFWTAIGQEIILLLINNPGTEKTLRRGFINSRVGIYMNRFADRDVITGWLAQYTDGWAPPTASGDSPAIVLCQPNGRSLVISRGLCSRDYETNVVRDPAFCPDGVSVTNLSTVRSCQGRAEGGTVNAHECVSSYGLQPPSR